jgi:putative nucleotidyltransferase with HDIG domain
MKSREETLNYAKSLACLPVMDAVTQRLSEILDEKRLSFSHLFECVRYDPGLSSKIIASANSVWHSRGMPTFTLKRAMTVLGLEEVKNLLLCTLFYEGVLRRLGLKKEDVFRLWEHSLLVAFAAAELCGGVRREMEKAYTAGLLHDMGKAPLQLLHRYDIVDKNVEWDAICANERDRFDTDHQETGFYMAVEWKLPEEYRDAIRLHHENSEASQLAQLVRQAHILLQGAAEDESRLAMKKTAEEKTRQIISLFVAYSA